MTVQAPQEAVSVHIALQQRALGPMESHPKQYSYNQARIHS